MKNALQPEKTEIPAVMHFLWDKMSEYGNYLNGKGIDICEAQAIAYTAF